MALNIVTSAQPLHIDHLITFIYGDPGVWKTSLAFTAKNPILFDFDKGAYRAGNRKDTVQIGSWGEVANISKDDLNGYDTIIIDTAGRVLDMITDDLKKDAKNIRRGSNDLSMQGYGKLGSMFTTWLKSLRNMGKDIVILAHAGEEKDGENVIKRPDMVGGSKKEVYKVADMMGYMTVVQGVNGAERKILFTPNSSYFAKDSGQLGDITVQPVTTHPTQLADIIQATKDRINSMSAEQMAYVKGLQDIDELRSELLSVETVKQLNDIKDGLDETSPAITQMKKDIWQIAKGLGFNYNKETEKFETVAEEPENPEQVEEVEEVENA